jgi:hypothetical protein
MRGDSLYCKGYAETRESYLRTVAVYSIHVHGKILQFSLKPEAVIIRAQSCGDLLGKHVKFFPETYLAIASGHGCCKSI